MGGCNNWCEEGAPHFNKVIKTRDLLLLLLYHLSNDSMLIVIILIVGCIDIMHGRFMVASGRYFI